MKDCILYTGLFCGGCEPYAHIDKWKIICLNNLLQYSESIGADFRVYGNENKPFWKFFDALESFGYNGWLAATMIKNYVVHEFIQSKYEMIIWSDLDILINNNDVITGPNQFDITERNSDRVGTKVSDGHYFFKPHRKKIFDSTYKPRENYYVLNSGFFSMDREFALKYLDFIKYNELDFYKRLKEITIVKHFPSHEDLMEIFLNNHIDEIKPLNNPFGFHHYISRTKSEIK